MVRTSVYTRPRSYTVLRKCCTRRAQACYLFTNIFLFLLLIVLGIGLIHVLLTQLEELRVADARDQATGQFENTTFMPYCDYFVSPWFLNLCNIQDMYIPRAWRMYRLFPGQHHSCINIQEEIKCSENKNFALLSDDDSFNMIEFCPSYNQLFNDADIVIKLSYFYPRKPYPRRKLNNFQYQIVRAVDIVAVCPICYMHPTKKYTTNKQQKYPTSLETLRFGWPISRSKCETDYQYTRALSNVSKIWRSLELLKTPEDTIVNLNLGIDSHELPHSKRHRFNEEL